VREAVKGDDLDAVKRASEELQRTSHAMAEQLYKQNQTNAANSANAHKDGVVDGEVVA
jgi:hypothetical protein